VILTGGGRSPLAPWKAQPIVTMSLVVAAVTAMVAATAVLAVRGLARQDARDSEQARTVIGVAKLRAGVERLSSSVRGMLITGDAYGAVQINGRSRELHARLHALEATLQPARRRTAVAVEQELDRLIAATKEALLLRQQISGMDAAHVFDNRLQPLRTAVDFRLDELAGAEEAELAALERAGDSSSSAIATVASVIAVAALLTSFLLALLLGRAFQSLLRKGHELERAKLRLETTNRDLEAFAARVAHDLRTPLTPIFLLAGSLLRHSKDEVVVRAAERICRSTRRASEMIDDLLLFSRGGRREDRGTTEAAGAVRDVLDLLAVPIGAAQVQVHTELDEQAVVACSAGLLRQVLENLVGNAVKHLAGRESRVLTVAARRAVGTVVLQVEDNGPGIPESCLPHIFEPFYRVPGSTTPGNGIGLATVQRIVEAHEGRVTVSSKVGRGSAFRVELPSGGAPEIVPPPPAPMGAPGAPEIAGAAARP
jgi:signal transduction histidine kinase